MERKQMDYIWVVQGLEDADLSQGTARQTLHGLELDDLDGDISLLVSVLAFVDGSVSSFAHELDLAVFSTDQCTVH